MAKVVRLHDGAELQDAGKCELVAAARKALEEIEAGEIIGFVGAVVRRDGLVTYRTLGVCADSPPLAATVATRLKKKIEFLLLG